MYLSPFDKLIGIIGEAGSGKRDVYKRQLLYSLSRVVRPAALHSRSAEKNCLTGHVSSLRSVKGATLPVSYTHLAASVTQTEIERTSEDHCTE